MNAVAADRAVNLEKAKRPDSPRADRLDFPNERAVTPERHPLQAVAEPEERHRGARLHIGLELVRERVGTGWLYDADRCRGNPQRFEIAIGEVGVAGLLGGLLQ